MQEPLTIDYEACRLHKAVSLGESLVEGRFSATSFGDRLHASFMHAYALVPQVALDSANISTPTKMQNQMRAVQIQKKSILSVLMEELAQGYNEKRLEWQNLPRI